MKKKGPIVKVMNTPSEEALEVFYHKFFELVVKPQLQNKKAA